MEPLVLQASNMDDYVLKHEGKAIVDFWADWCAPCRTMSPIFNELAEEAPEEIVIGKVNIDTEPELAQQFGVMSIPTIIFFENGQEVDRIIGAVPKEKIKRFF